jgi:multiple sugar transport system substrate-binding protein
MKKLTSLLLALLLILSAMPAAFADEPVTITFAFWDTNQEPGMRAIADAYTAKHPNVTIETQVTPGPSTGPSWKRPRWAARCPT